MTHEHNFIDLTKHLLVYIEESQDYYNQYQQIGTTPDFYKVVKPFADEVRNTLDVWKKEGEIWINMVKPKNFHLLQLQLTAENIERVSISCFFPESSESKMTSHIQSVRYTLQKIVDYQK